MLRATQHVVRTLAAIRFALSTRRDLLLEMLALRHQLAVLARSNRRFRPSDRLLWLILRRVWLRWRDALVLVQPDLIEQEEHVSRKCVIRLMQEDQLEARARKRQRSIDQLVFSTYGASQ